MSLDWSSWSADAETWKSGNAETQQMKKNGTENCFMGLDRFSGFQMFRFPDFPLYRPVSAKLTFVYFAAIAALNALTTCCQRTVSSGSITMGLSGS